LNGHGEEGLDNAASYGAGRARTTRFDVGRPQASGRGRPGTIPARQALTVSVWSGVGSVSDGAGPRVGAARPIEEFPVGPAHLDAIDAEVECVPYRFIHQPGDGR